MSQSVHQKGVYFGRRVLALFSAYVERELAIRSNLHTDTSSWFQIHPDPKFPEIRGEIAAEMRSLPCYQRVLGLLRTSTR